MNRILLGSLLAIVPLAHSAVVINELHYNPPASQGDDALFEYIELYNSGGSAVDLGGWTLEGVTHSFAEGTLLEAGNYLVVAKDAATVQAAYGLTGTVVQWTSGSLDNSGETLRLADAANTTICSFLYDDSEEWGAAADGGGSSLELRNPGMDPALASSWGASLTSLGTPGTINSIWQDDAAPNVGTPWATPAQPGSGDTILVSVEAGDDHGLLSVHLLWSVSGGEEQSQEMAGQDGVYQASIGPFPDGSVVSLTAHAEDNLHQTGTSALGLVHISDDPITGADLFFSEIQYTDWCWGRGDWVELHNASAQTIELGGWVFRDNDDGHQFTLPAGTLIEAGGFLVLSQDAANLAQDYGIANVAGDFDFGLSSGGDAVRLFDPWGVCVDEVAYGVGDPWPGAPVGGGPSLSLIGPALDNSLPASWTASAEECGTPGREGWQLPLAAPQVAVGVAGGQLLLSWNAVPEAVDYVVEIADISAGPWSQAAVTTACAWQEELPLSTPLRLYRVRARE